MKSIAEFFNDCNEILNGVTTFFDKYIGKRMLHRCGIAKLVDNVKIIKNYNYADHPILRLIGDAEDSIILEKCVSAAQLLKDKIVLCFHDSSAYRMFSTGTYYGDYKKDTFYRFDTMPNANWELLQQKTAANVINDIEKRTTDNHLRALVFDDSLYSRTRGKGTELCGKVYDHNDHKLRIGYRMMTCLWTNGESHIPVSQALLTTRDESLMVGPEKDFDRRTVRGKRRFVAKQKGTSVVMGMVKNAIRQNIPYDCILFDTWFSNPTQLIDLKEIGADVIAMIKKNSTKYTYFDPQKGEAVKLNVKEIYNRNKKRRGKSKYLLSIDVTITNKTGDSIPAKLIYARNRSNRKDWVCFVCTNLDYDEETVLHYYGARWSIETYFKIAKGCLKLRTECHSTNYDALTAHMVIVAIRYMILTVERFNNTDNRTIEEIFCEAKREVVNALIDNSVIFVLDAILNCVRDYFQASDSQIESLINMFIDSLPMPWKSKFNSPKPDVA